ncbi:dTDP-glucose 4,6-dehydratase [Candidatus Woesebacteria bacterium]|nr:dTDP-glucose 4,6-dehydratase [Candidatus Woesebacteria bacterium]
MRLLVTGGAGFIGSNFIQYWLAGHPSDQIVNLDSLTYAGNLENLTSVQNNPNYSFIKGAIGDPQTVHEAIAGVDVVVHFAAETHVDRSIKDPTAFVRTNVEGTLVLLQEAVQAKVQRFHHISTDEVFGSLELGSDQKFNENTKYDPHSPYSASKAGSDHLVRAFGDTYKLPYTISNCSNNYGPFHFPEKLIPLAITNVLEGKKIPVYGNGLQVRDWLYVIDHCSAIEAVLLKGKEGETYCVGGMSQDVPNVEVIKMILSEMGQDESLIEYVTDRPGHDVRYAIDWSKIERELSWKPSCTLQEGIKKTVAWYKENESWWKRAKSGEYQTYYQQQYAGSV